MPVQFVNDRWATGKYIVFRNLGPMANRKTNTYEVLAKKDNFLLGRIRWYSPWCKYTFEPTPDTIFEEYCLRDIAEFCETETKKHKTAVRREKKIKRVIATKTNALTIG